jgi:hypothetical protein
MAGSEWAAAIRPLPTSPHRPALTFQEFLETVDRLIRAGKVKGPTNLRSSIYLSLANVELGTSIEVKPPQMLIGGLAFIGRRLGYRGMTWPTAGSK